MRRDQVVGVPLVPSERGDRIPGFVDVDQPPQRRPDRPAGRDSTTILPPCCTSRVAVASPAARSSRAVSQPELRYTDHNQLGRSGHLRLPQPIHAGHPRSRTECSRPAMTSAMPEAAGTSPTWNPLPKSQLTSNDSSRLHGRRPPARRGPSPFNRPRTASKVSRSVSPGR